MILETILGSALGGIARMAPEVLKWLDRKDERKHELSLLDKTTAIESSRQVSVQRLADTEANQAITTGELDAMVEAIKAQGQLTGIKFVDALNSLIRPLLALQWLILLWPSVIVAGIVLAVQAGVSPIQAVAAAWGPDEKAMASAIAAFWLVDRSIRRSR